MKPTIQLPSNKICSKGLRKPENCLKILKMFSQGWESRSRVRKNKLEDESEFYLDKPDFLEDLLPFYKSKFYDKLIIEKKNKILSYAWIIYNLKTIHIESKIISPVCYRIIDGSVPGASHEEIKRVMSETLVDESYHILLCQYVISLTKKKRNINYTNLPDFDLIRKTNLLKQKYYEPWQIILIELATAIVSEVFISDYLLKVSESKEINPLNRHTVKAHRMDEMAHGKIFKIVAHGIFNQLTTKEKDFFFKIIPHSIQLFSSKELYVWNHILNDICPSESTSIINDSLRNGWHDLSKTDYSEIEQLMLELGSCDFMEIFQEFMHNNQSYQKIFD